MISVIICSREKRRLETLLQNIKNTIGVPYEVIAVDNAVKNEGICSVYNTAAGKASFDLLCFVHEDVIFSTENWGRKMAMHLKNPCVGLIGIAGGDAKSLVPSSWYIPVRSNHIHVFQHYRYKDISPEHIRITDNADNNPANRVSVLDGVFLCTRKEILLQYHFDETRFPGFHGYDIDFSLQVSCSYQLLAISDILIHHYSEGNPGKEWMESTLKVSDKWKRKLPVSVHDLSPKQFGDHHWAAMQMFIQRMVDLNYPSHILTYYFLKYSFGRFFTPRRFGSMTKYLLGCLASRSRDGRRQRAPELKTI
jgi:hypothetical protein